MSTNDLYSARLNAHGDTLRKVAYNREKHMLEDKMRNSLSYYTVDIDGEERNASVINSDNLNEKILLSYPGEDIDPGAIVAWMDNHWLVTEKDASNELYTRAKMIQCNHLLKWVDENDNIHEQWCVIEDGTKYMTGDYEDRDFVVNRGDARIAMTITRNEYTEQFTRNSRFIISDEGSKEKLAFDLTKPLTVGAIYNGKGVYKFVLSETMSTKYDNMELGIADYYKHFPEGEHATEFANDIESAGRTVGENGRWL